MPLIIDYKYYLYACEVCGYEVEDLTNVDGDRIGCCDDCSKDKNAYY